MDLTQLALLHECVTPTPSRRPPPTFPRIFVIWFLCRLLYGGDDSKPYTGSGSERSEVCACALVRGDALFVIRVLISDSCTISDSLTPIPRPSFRNFSLLNSFFGCTAFPARHVKRSIRSFKQYPFSSAYIFTLLEFFSSFRLRIVTVYMCIDVQNFSQAKKHSN